MGSKVADLLRQRKKCWFNLNNDLDLVFYTFSGLSVVKIMPNTLPRLELCLWI